MRMTDSQLYDYLHENYTYDNAGLLYPKKNQGTHMKKNLPAGTSNTQGYLQITINKYVYQVHRLIYIYHYGSILNTVTHKDRNRSNNAIENLVDVSRSLVRSTQTGTPGRTSQTGRPGVYLNKTTNKYRAMVQISGQKLFLGEFKSIEDASKSYDLAKKTANKILQGRKK